MKQSSYFIENQKEPFMVETKLEPKDLISGNLIDFKGGKASYQKVIEVREHDLVVNFIGDLKTGKMKPFTLDYDEIEPIPLTPELLEKCGFKNLSVHDEDGNERGEFWYKQETDFAIATDDSSETFYKDGNKKVELKYLHQLQNLYFALTGEELVISL